MSHIVLHAGDYGYVNGSPMYVVHVNPGSDYAFMADCYNQHRVVNISDFQFKGHLIKDLHLFFDDCYIDFNILTSTGMFTVVRIGTETFCSSHMDEIYQGIFQRAVKKMVAPSPVFHCVDDTLLNGYVRLTPDSNPNEYFNLMTVYPIINGVLFDQNDEGEYDLIYSVEELNERESDNGTCRHWEYVCSLEDGLRVAREQQKQGKNQQGCDCEQCVCEGCE